MPTLLGHFQSRRLERLCVGHMVTTNDSTHGGLCGEDGGVRVRRVELKPIGPDKSDQKRALTVESV
jgi:hypothetical protein